MSRRWWALFRPDKDDPVDITDSKGLLIDWAIEDSGGPSWILLLREPPKEAKRQRDAAWKRLKRRGWWIERLPEGFWASKQTLGNSEVAIHWRRYPEEVPPLDAGTLLFLGPESDHPIEDRQDPHLGDYREAEDWGEGNEGFYCQRPECDCLVPGVRLWVPVSELAPREGR